MRKIVDDTTEEQYVQELSEEVVSVRDWRRTYFRQVLGENVSDEDIESLVVSDSSPSQALNLRNRECPDHLIVKILA